MEKEHNKNNNMWRSDMRPFEHSKENVKVPFKIEYAVCISSNAGIFSATFLAIRQVSKIIKWYYVSEAEVLQLQRMQNDISE